MLCTDVCGKQKLYHELFVEFVQKKISQWRRGSKWQLMVPYQSSPVLKRLGCLMATNKVKDADQHTVILLSNCDPATYWLIRHLASLKKLTELKFQDIADLIMKHHDLKPSAIVQRYRFNTRNCRAGESISTYVAELRHVRTL